MTRANALGRGTAHGASSRRRERATTRAMDGDDDEFAVFRFTLGSEWLADEDVPRVVGAAGAAGLCANAVVAGANAGEALGRSEAIGMMLVIGCLIAPALGRRVMGGEDGAGGGRAGAGDDAGSTFAMDDDAGERAREDLAWASYAALTNTLAQGVMYVDRTGRVRVVRGRVRAREDGGADGSKADALARVSRAWSEVASSSSSTRDETFSTYLSSRRDIDREGANEWAFLPPDAESVFASRPPRARGVIVAWSDASRAFGRKDRSWLEALALKLDAAFASS